MSNQFQRFRFNGEVAPHAVEECKLMPDTSGTTAAPPAEPQRSADGVQQTHPRTVHEKVGGKPLRLLIVGHNPSDHAWHSGHFYSHPSNHMWRLLKKSGIAPDCIEGAEDDDKMLELAGVGFSDVGNGSPGTDSSQFKSAQFKEWGKDFYQRLQKHMANASAAIGCTCGKCGAPAVVAFSGKRHYVELMKLKAPGTAGSRSSTNPAAKRARTNGSSASVEVGIQQEVPPGWPLPPSTEVWVMSSTSGASALSREQREGPWMQLGERVTQMPWPMDVVPACVGESGQASEGEEAE